MFRGVGLGMIFFASMGCAYLYNQQMADKIAELERLVDMLDYIALEIKEARKALPDIFLMLAERLPKDYQKALQDLVYREGAEEDNHMSILFRENMSRVLELRGIGERDREPFLAVFDTGEMGLEENILGRIRRAKEKLTDRIHREEQEYWKKKGFVTRIGILAGGIIVLILM